MPISDPLPAVASAETAGWLLATRRLAVANGLPWPSVDEIFEATGANREHAHAIEDAITAALPALEQSLSQGCGEGWMQDVRCVADASATRNSDEPRAAADNDATQASIETLC
ncbi:MAG: hypothetical protein H0X05_03190 [Actinobacteria bacterium]|nr:hypothetical protein [Actinomycetota bacterium]